MQHQSIKNRDIILFSLQPWDSGIAFNFRDMAFELARYNRVVFINRAMDRWTIISNLFTGKTGVKRKGLEKIQENFWLFSPESILESGNWLPVYAAFDFFNQINNKRLAKEIRHVLMLLGFSDCLLINDNDFYRGLYLKKLLGVKECIYCLRDFLTIQPYFKKFGPRCEREMIEKADLVVTNSEYLTIYARHWNPNCTNIGQGFRMEDFMEEDLPVPGDLSKISKPVIGYFGAISEMRLDRELIAYIANALPEMNLVLVGPEDRRFRRSGLHKKKNIFFLGHKSPRESASYIRHFTVCINPQLVNPLTMGNYPRKIDEYLICGKPVVAVSTEAMDLFREHILVSNSAAAFVENIRKAVKDPYWNSEEMKRERMKFARSHTWETVVEKMTLAYSSILENKQKII